MKSPTLSRVGFYIDGCNLHQGLRAASWRKFYWLDLEAFAKEYLRDGQTLVCTKYFTARVVANPEKNKRHSTYIDALRAVGRVEIIEGKFQQEPFHCPGCRRPRQIPKEKLTDTNIATAMVVDAFKDVWDVAFVVSGDADLVPPIKAIRAEFPHKGIVVVSPPCRSSRDLDAVATGSKFTNPAMLGRCQLPDEICLGEVIYKRPEKWQ